jgi:hypothetical protein
MKVNAIMADLTFLLSSVLLVYLFGFLALNNDQIDEKVFISEIYSSWWVFDVKYGVNVDEICTLRISTNIIHGYGTFLGGIEHDGWIAKVLNSLNDDQIKVKWFINERYRSWWAFETEYGVNFDEICTLRIGLYIIQIHRAFLVGLECDAWIPEVLNCLNDDRLGLQWS